MTRVIDGGWTFSCSASSPGVIASCTSRADNAASWVSDSTASVKPEAVRSARKRRASLLTEIRRAVASPPSVLVWVTVIRNLALLPVSRLSCPLKYITSADHTRPATPTYSGRVTETRRPEPRPAPPPPLEANERLVTGSITACWAVALIVLVIIRGSLPGDARWWLWTCVTGLAMGLFGLWYVPRLQRGRARAAAQRAAGPDQSAPEQVPPDQVPPDHSAPRDSGSNTVSSTETPGKSTRS